MTAATAEIASSVRHWRYTVFMAGGDLQPRDRHVALALAGRADPRTLRTCASRAQLATDTGRSTADVRAAVRVLADRQLITRTRELVRQRPNVYLLTIPAIPRESP